MSVLKAILKKEFRQIFRDKTILAMMFALPTIQLIVLPLAMNFDVKNINLAIVDHDGSDYAQKLITKVGSSGYFKIVGEAPSYQTALRYVEKEEADVIMEIPAGFERNLVREGKQTISLSADAINATKSSIGSAYLSSVIGDFAGGLDINVQAGVDAGAAADAGRSGASGGAGTIDIRYSNWFNPLAEYKYYIVPGILVLLLTMIGGFMAALNIVREKEMGTIEQINVSPIKKWEFILGKLIPFWVIGMIVFTIGLTVCRIVYGITPAGSIALLYCFAGVYLVALLGFGLLISTFSDNQVQAMFVAFFFMMIFTLMSGLFTSVDSMPAWARTISNLIPVTHFVKVVRMIVLKGSGFGDVRVELGYISVFAVVLNGWAIWNYRKTA
jgi:drug efflux transport system permease protein